MKKLLVLSLLAAAFAAAPAQEPTPTPNQNQRQAWLTWDATFPGGGEYWVRLDTITSVSIHDYVLDGAVLVTEVNIATAGSELARFYYVEINKPSTPGNVGQSIMNLAEEKGKDLMTRAGQDEAINRVVKNYPTTTHAHTVEYRLKTKDSLRKLFESVRDAVKNRKSASFKP